MPDGEKIFGRRPSDAPETPVPLIRGASERQTPGPEMGAATGRRAVASQAVLNSAPLTVTARLLGHSDVLMTMRHAHIEDRDIQAAAERVGRAIDAILRRRTVAPGP